MPLSHGPHMLAYYNCSNENICTIVLCFKHRPRIHKSRRNMNTYKASRPSHTYRTPQRSGQTCLPKNLPNMFGQHVSTTIWVRCDISLFWFDSDWYRDYINTLHCTIHYCILRILHKYELVHVRALKRDCILMNYTVHVCQLGHILYNTSII